MERIIYLYIPNELIFLIPLGTVAAVHYLAILKKIWAPAAFILAGACSFLYVASLAPLITTSGSGDDASGISSMQPLISFLVAGLVALIPVPPEWRWVRNTVGFLAGWILTVRTWVA